MKLSNPKKWYIKDAPPNVNMVKHLPLSLNFPDKPLFQEVLFTPNDLQTVCSSRTSKKKPSKLTNSKQPRPPSAEITQRNPNPHTPNQNQLSFSLKSKLKPSLYNNISITSPKIKSKPQNTFSLTQKSFHPQNHQKPSTKAKTLNEMPTDGLFEQSSKSTQCINESSKSIQLLNETFLTVKAENPENSVKNIPFISPVNNMMRRLTFNEKERDILSTNTIMTSEEKPILNNKENLPTTKEEDIVLPEPKKISIRSFSQNSRVPSNETSLHTKTQTPSARNKGQPNSPKNENDETLTFAIRSKTNIQASSSEKQKDEINALQKITDLVKEINDLENQGGDYHQMRTCVLALEEKLTDLKSSIELKRPHHHIFKKQIPFNSPENKENKQSFVKEIPHIASTHIVASENILNSIVTSARPFVKDETKEKEGIISIIQVQSLLNSKHKYPKSTTNADVKKKKFAFQNKPASIKLQTLNPQEELIPEEPQGINSIIPKHSSIALVSSLEDEIQPMNNRTYYISNTVNAFYKPLNIYSDGCQDNYFTQLCQEHMIQTFQSLHLSRNLFDNIENHCFKEKYIELPKKESHKYMKTLIFDLDETLVHCNENLELPADVILPIKFPNGQKIEAGINIRPYTKELLKELSKYYEIIVFTASHSCYANVVLDYLDEKKEYIHHRMYREHCISTKEGVFIKDLRVIKNRELKNMIIVDNAAYSFAFQIENGIPILPFYDFKADRELVSLQEYLKKLTEVEDILEINRNTFKLKEYEKYEEIQVLIESELKNYVY